jgi:hypothetical protein
LTADPGLWGSARVGVVRSKLDVLGFEKEGEPRDVNEGFGFGEGDGDLVAALVNFSEVAFLVITGALLENLGVETGSGKGRSMKDFTGDLEPVLWCPSLKGSLGPSDLAGPPEESSRKRDMRLTSSFFGDPAWETSPPVLCDLRGDMGSAKDFSGLLGRRRLNGSDGVDSDSFLRAKGWMGAGWFRTAALFATWPCRGGADLVGSMPPISDNLLPLNTLGLGERAGFSL